MDDQPRPKQIKTADEIASLIHADLSQVEGCPKQGVEVTVYGMPWRSLLMFKATAGPVKNKAELHEYFNIITERLQRLYDIRL